MADTVQNPFDTTKQSDSGSAGAGLVGSNMTGGNTYTTPAPAADTVSQFEAVNRTVDPATQTVAGQVDSILASDSPLMQRARTLATQQMAQRGLVNSSMAEGAGVAAMMDRALPMAQQDANTYNAVASDNMAARNQAGLFNSGAQNQFSLQSGAQKFTASQADLDRAQQTALADKNIQAQQQLQLSQQGFQAGQASLDRTQQATLQSAQFNFTAAQSALDRAQQTYLQDKSFENQQALQLAQQTFAGAQASLDRAQQVYLQNDSQQFQATMQDDAQAFQTSMTQLQQSFTAAQASLDRAQQTYLQDDMQSFQSAMQKATVPSQFASQISTSLMSSVNQIAGDPNLSGTVDGIAPAGSSPKSRAIQSAINYANSQLSWASQFYGTTINPFPTA